MARLLATLQVRRKCRRPARRPLSSPNSIRYQCKPRSRARRRSRRNVRRSASGVTRFESHAVCSTRFGFALRSSFSGVLVRSFVGLVLPEGIFGGGGAECNSVCAPMTGGGGVLRPGRPHGTRQASTCACGVVTRPSATSAYAVPRSVSLPVPAGGRTICTPAGHHAGKSISVVPATLESRAAQSRESGACWSLSGDGRWLCPAAFRSSAGTKRPNAKPRHSAESPEVGA